MKNSHKTEFTLLDIGAGGCDIDKWAIMKARRSGIKLNITAIDNDGRIIPSVRLSLKNYPEINLVHASALGLKKDDKYDFIFANHFLHHLEKDDIGRIIAYAMSAAKTGFLFNDIKRTPGAFIFYTIFSAIFMHGSFAFYDGRLSIRKGFRREDLSMFINDKIELLEAFPSRIYISGFNTAETFR
jgi:2-polyprenyl-3-methyl-5-hydroxy-6-metoxy-1,4-benzoquinol methylase